jgi:hypothetical protein
VQHVIDRLEALLGVAGVEVEWSRGYWSRLRFHDDLPAFRALLAHPSARFLRDLEIGDRGADRESYAPFLDGLPRTLRSIHLGRGVRAGDRTLYRFIELALPPRLESIRIECNVHRIAALPSERLRSLSFGDGFFAPVESLATLSMPVLEELALRVDDAAWPGHGGEGLFDPARVPALRRLSLFGAGTNVCGSLADSGLFRQLEVLRLSGASLLDREVDTLLERGLDRLKTLVLASSFISRESISKLSYRPFQLRIEV